MHFPGANELNSGTASLLIQHHAAIKTNADSSLDPID